jgi:peptide/nickel transport system permease protein
VLAQYADWVADVALRGEFGTSFVTGRQVSAEVAAGLPVTLSIVLLAFAIAVGLGIPLGVATALWPGGWFDRGTRVLTVAGLSVPAFWLGLLLIRLFAVDLRWLPPGGWVSPASGLGAHLASTILPAVSLAVYYVAVLGRMMGASLGEVLRSDHVRTARAMGLPRRRVVGYAMRNALAPVISLAALSFGYMFGWALIVEQVFNVPGLSRALLAAIAQRDFLLLQGVVFLFTLVFVAANLLADLINRGLDPRLRGA